VSELCLFSIILLIVIAVPVKTLLDYYHNKSLPDLWNRFSQANGFTLIPGEFSAFFYNWPKPPAVKGKYRNFDYILSLKETIVKRDYYTFNHEKAYRYSSTFININLPAITGSAFYIYNKNLPYKTEEKTELKKVLSGYREIDAVFTIESEIQDITKILTEELVKKILYDRDICERDIIYISFNGQNLHYETSGIIRDVNTLQNLTEIMGEMACNIFATESDFKNKKELQDLSDQQDTREEWLCPSCNTSVSIKERYCINCGQKR